MIKSNKPNCYNRMFIPICTFNDIIITNSNTLVICDIDNTLIYWNKTPKDFYNTIINDCPDFTQEEIEKEAIDYNNMYRMIKPPCMTDSDGFNNLREKIKSLHNSKIIFLTARTEQVKNNNSFMRKNFKAIDLDYDEFDIHYTNNMISKGEYIQKNINHNDYDKIIFIDDYVSYIKSVKDIFPNTICYKFEHIQSKL